MKAPQKHILGKTVAASMLCASLVFSSVTPATIHTAHAAVTTSIKLQNQQTIAHGAQHKVYTKQINSQTVRIEVLEINLGHQYIKVAPLYGTHVGQKDTVTGMAKQSGAVAALNSSFFNMQNEGGTMGVLVKDGNIVSNPDKQENWNSFAILNDQTAIIQKLGFTGQILAPNGASFSLEGINKTEYWPNNSPASNYSGTIHKFTPEWAETSRGKLPGYSGIVELEVTNDVVTDIRLDQPGKAIPADGYVLMGHGNGASFLQNNFSIGDPVQTNYQLSQNVEQAIGANYLLVNQGQRVSTSHVESNLKGRNSRSALGVSQNGKTLYMVSIDKVDSNPGVSLEELADILIELGSFKAVNLDGGGSTSMVVRTPGELSAARVNKTTWERSVADALGIFNTAPKGNPVDLNIAATSLVMPGDLITLTAKGYDSNYHPITNADVEYKVSDPTAELTNNQLKFTQSGRHLLQASYNGISTDLPIRVLAAEDVKQFTVSPSDILVLPGEKQELKATLHLNDGRTFDLKPEHIQWANTQAGQMNDMTFQAVQSKTNGKLQANVLGLSTTIDIEVSYSFRDIKGHWAQQTIERMAELGHAKGIGAGRFGPNTDVKRGDFVVFLSRILNWNITDREKNVALNETVPAYTQDALKYAKHHGILRGDQNGLLNANAPISRMEMATILQRVLGTSSIQPAKTVTTPMNSLYADWSNVPEWARGSVEYVSEREIFGGMNNRFYPRNHTTRAEVMTVLQRAFVK
ncbi:phosphodiester glycosidase family protein [Bacillus horti]|uniref:Exopolysaccharide biosynthesis protein n=1 Tax=Caldalkalibacillus horti TaxID=77523 RepID=A0ABT9VTS1_9BACI|nr:phosphodiester glycosidase family protein [Bacillus horti]MDQ0164377.1 exopolysaccharide biosynthesis protein [Bacillus horti]